jgi:hypothetical protein
MAASDQNLRIWHSVKKTDPSYTKPFSRAGGFKGTDINPLWRMMRMTEEFGPIGQGWGYEVLETRFDHLTDGQALVFALVKVWYREDGQTERYEVGPQWGGTQLIAARKDGKLFVDDEAPKKAVTDGITKCLSYLGVSADVYLGMFEDSKYLRSVAEEYRAEKQEEAAAEKIKPEVKGWRDMVLAELPKITTVAALERYWKEQQPAFRECIDKYEDKATAKLIKDKVTRRAAELKDEQAAPEPEPEDEIEFAP